VGTFSIIHGKITREKGVYMINVLLFLASFLAYSQDFQYRLEGSFQSRADKSLDQPITVNYSLNWSETSDEIQGIYRDNYFSPNANKIISGTISSEGRKFNLIFSAPTQDVKQLTLSTTQTGALSGTIPLTINTFDAIGITIDSLETVGLMTTLPTLSQNKRLNDDQNCIIGFGSLTGLCGLYSGTFQEMADNRNRCDLLGGNNPRLELSSDTIFRVYLDYIPGTPSPLIHNIGAFLPSPTSNTISVTGRTCGPLPRTSFEAQNCRTLNLSGIFSVLGNSVQFNGTYSIRDDVNADTCSFTLILNREVIY